MSESSAQAVLDVAAPEDHEAHGVPGFATSVGPGVGSGTAEVILEEMLVEEVSIDGMCGVY